MKCIDHNFSCEYKKGMIEVCDYQCKKAAKTICSVCGKNDSDCIVYGLSVCYSCAADVYEGHKK